MDGDQGQIMPLTVFANGLRRCVPNFFFWFLGPPPPTRVVDDILIYEEIFFYQNFKLKTAQQFYALVVKIVNFFSLI